jgi:hypothetical protein
LTKYYDDPKHNAAFERCIDVMTKLILKYGPQVLERIDKEPAKTADTHKDGKNEKTIRSNEI